MRSAPNFPLIAGAGPVGLAAALFLAREGVQVRIIDAARGPSAESKALAVNPRTLEILEPTGVTKEMLALGKPIHGAHIWHNKKVIGGISFKDLDHKYPFMLALSQAVTCRLLETRLNRLGIYVDWDTRLNHLKTTDDGAEAELKIGRDDEIEEVHCPWMVAADGVHSTARRELGIPFEGKILEHPWYLVDLPLHTSLREDCAQVFQQDGGGFVFLIRVIDEPEKNARPAPIWRVIGSMPDPVSRLNFARPAGPPIWQSSFHISHSINRTMQEGNVFFAGDAAHVHSPIGARGMNLGIEDAWVFSELFRENKHSSYGEMRRKVDRRVVRQIEKFTRLVIAKSTLTRMMRRMMLPMMTHTPVLRNRMIHTLTGLDHPLTAMPARSRQLEMSMS